MSASEMNRSAVVRLPAWLWGNAPESFAAEAGWRAVLEDEQRGLWRAQLEENARRVAPRLVRADLIANKRNASKVGSYARLTRLKLHDQIAPTALWQTVLAEHRRITDLYPSDLGAMLGSARILTMGAPEAELPRIVRTVLEEMLFPIGLPEAAVHLVEIDRSLTYRFTATRVLVYAQENPAPPAPGQDPPFSAARGLFSDTTFGLSAYLEPLLTSLSPWLWGMTASRAGGVVVYLFGRVITGRQSTTAEPLQLSLPLAQPEPNPLPELASTAFTAAMRWWISRLNKVLSEATDPCNYTRNGVYEPQLALERLLSVEQLFRHAQAVAGHVRDDHTRRVLLFNFLDTHEGLRIGPDWHTAVLASKARKVLDDLRGQIPADAQQVLLPRATAAVEALERLQQGFFSQSRRHNDTLLLPDKSGKETAVSLEKAAGLWLRVVRNGQHGFGGRTHIPDAALLSSHDGNVPRAVPDLAWLYLLRLMANPERLRRHIPT